MTNLDFFHDLRLLAKTDLSKAHLLQHFTLAKKIVNAAGIDVQGQTTWSSMKPLDTVIYSSGHITGKKHWISGVPDCQWVTFAAKEGDNVVIVLVDAREGLLEMTPTIGMEDTITAHMTFKNAPAKKILNRTDPRMFLIDAELDLSFITNHLGLAEQLFEDINHFTNNDFSYHKKKLRLDIEVFKTLWEIELSNDDLQNNQEFWDRRRILYAFGKKTLLNLVQFVTEVTGSGLYEISMPTNQRYKDALIYSTHMRNLNTCFKNLFN